MSAYRTTGEADEDLIAIFIQGHDLFGARQADRYLDELHALFQRLAEHPAMTWLRTDYDPPVRIYAYRSHMVVYEEAPEGIVILRVRHGHEDWWSDPRSGPA